MAENYILQVTAGTDYDITTQKVVSVNQGEPLHISSEHIDVDLNVRIQDYRGLPRFSPATSPYFSLPPHDRNNDQYSISFKFTPKHSMNGDDLVFGNDFDHPIRDRLPPMFGAALKFVKWMVDPGLDGDVYADKPYLYGPLASSINTLRVGEIVGQKTEEKSEVRGDIGKEGEGLVFEEGGEGDGEVLRIEKRVPETDAARKKFFLIEQNRKDWEFEAGREHWGDFYNPYLDFNSFALRLPGIHIPIMRYWDGQSLRKELKRSHTLRYVLKNRKTGTVYLVVLFTLYLKQDVNEDGTIKKGVIGGQLRGNIRSDDDEEDEEEEEGEQDDEHKIIREKAIETSADDVD